MKKLSVSLPILSFVFAVNAVYAQSVVPVTSTTIYPTTAASPVVTSATTTATTSYTAQTTLMDIYLQQAAADAAALQKQADAEATAQSNASSYAAMIQLAMKVCPWTNGSDSKEKTSKDMKKVDKKASEQNQAAGNQIEPNIDPKTQQQVGQARDEAVSGESCDIFINKEGKMGPQGRVALAVIKEHPESFEKKVPSDIGKFCPNYKAMSADQRQLYWIWVGLSVSSPESNCSPKDGLFKAAAKGCGQADSSDADANTRCFYSTLAKDLKSRGSLTTSKTDDKTSVTRELLSQYPFCEGDAKNAAKASDQVERKDRKTKGPKKGPKKKSDSESEQSI